MIARASSLTLFAMAAVLGGCSQGKSGEPVAGEPQYVKAHSMQQLMAQVVQPTAEVFWGSVQYISDETGEHEIVPKTAEDWQRTRTAAAALTEMGNLLMTPVHSEGRGADWMEFSRGLIEVGQEAEQAAANRDVDAVFEVGGTMYNVCTACHQAYLPEEQAAEANASQ
jgi:cytochrome c556